MDEAVNARFEHVEQIIEGLAYIAQDRAANFEDSDNGSRNNGQQGMQITMEQFQKLRPPTFDGSTDPAKAEAWVRRMEKIFKVFACPEEECYLYIFRRSISLVDHNGGK